MNFDVLPQILVNGLSAGALYALVATGLSLFFGIMKFINFSHGIVGAFAAYLFLTFSQMFGWPLLPSLFAALLSLLLISIVILFLTFLPAKDSPRPYFLLVISIGIAIVLENLILILWGSRVYSLTSKIQAYSFFDGKLIFTTVQVAILVATVSLFLFLLFFLKKTKMGKAIRAVSDNQEVAAVLGMDIRKILVTMFSISVLFAGIAGILASYELNLNYKLGLFLTLKGAAAVILGGMGSIPGAITGAFIIGLAENIFIGIPLGGFYIPSGYKDAVAFVILMLILYLRPTGLFGSRAEEAARK